MTVSVNQTDNRLECLATIIAPQGTWRWQQRLQVKRYTALRLRKGGLAWGAPEFLRNISGGNLRSPRHWKGERSPYMQTLTAEECMLIYWHRLDTPAN